MERDFVHISSIVVLIMFVSIAVFLVLLSFGYPLGEFAMSGYYKVLPKRISNINIIV